jgi:hypothetical protein
MYVGYSHMLKAVPSSTHLEAVRARASSRLFHLFSKGLARERLKPDIFSNVSKPAKTRYIEV